MEEFRMGNFKRIFFLGVEWECMLMGRVLIIVLDQTQKHKRIEWHENYIFQFIADNEVFFQTVRPPENAKPAFSLKIWL